MKDREFLMWLHDRLVHVHCTSPYLDYMHKLRCIIDTIPPEQVTANLGNISEKVLEEINTRKTR